jgi:hypothetical protein
MPGKSVYIFRWTGLLTAGDTKVPTSGDEYIDMLGATRVTFQINTNPVDTGAPTVDLHVWGANDEATAYFVSVHANVVAAQAKDVYSAVVAGNAATMLARWLKLRLDVNTASIAANEYVEVRVFVDRRKSGPRYERDKNTWP